MGSANLLKIFVTFGGLGLSPYAPGTLGSLGALIGVYILNFFPWPVFFGGSIIFCAFSLWAVGAYLKNQENKNHSPLTPEDSLQKHGDPQEIVVDEVMGILISFFLVPINPINLCVGFLLFRLLDIFKPPPISLFERKVSGAAGVMGDDMLAGFFVNIIFHGLWIPYFS